MDLVRIYECLCDSTRLRILALLGGGPLCVCHIQDILGESQVKISKHLAYLKTRGLVESSREGNWMMYSIAAKPSPELKANLACLQDCSREDPVFKRDSTKLTKLRTRLAKPACPCAIRTAAKRST
ncbi:MAG: winged helix-turn-helix transcriptional regulator [Verrucomicrobia bacterium]|nr:winged helix-turn-helix transcriptional regulator [Verrucomicrobiota bacterium]